MARMMGFPSLYDSKGTWHHYGSMILAFLSGSQLRQWNSASAAVDPVGSGHHIAAVKTPHRCPLVFPGSPNSPCTLFEVIREVDMQDPVTKAELY